MRFKHLLIAAVFAMSTLLPKSGTAALFIEPYLGYQFAGSISSNNLDFGDYKGLGGGARAAIQIIDLLYVGADFSYYPSLGFSSGNNTSLDGGASQTRLGAVAGVSIPVLPLRFWLGYNFIDKISQSNTTLDGSSFKLGAGLKLVPLVSLNLEYFFTNNGSASVNDISTDIDATGKALVFSVSLPLSL
jgi:hypothetical protein